MKTGGPLKSNNMPTLAYFWFYSPTAGNGNILHVSQQFNFAPDQKDVLKQRPDLAQMRWREMSDYTTVIPWQNAIPDNTMTVMEAVALAQKSGLAEDCAGTNPYYGCGNITRADLHVYIVGANQLLPVWRLTFGQDARAGEIVRLVNASSGKLITNCTVPGASVAATERTNLYLECR